jgi:hypothetical protein
MRECHTLSASHHDAINADSQAMPLAASGSLSTCCTESIEYSLAMKRQARDHVKMAETIILHRESDTSRESIASAIVHIISSCSNRRHTSTQLFPYSPFERVVVRHIVTLVVTVALRDEDKDLSQ